MPKLSELPNLVLDLHDNAKQIVVLLKKCFDGLDDIAADKMTAKLNEQKAATKRLFASFNEDLSPNIETIAKPKSTPEAVLKAAKAAKIAMVSYESSINKVDDETQHLSLLRSKLSAMLQLVEAVIKDPSNLTARKKLLVENWSKAKKDVEKAVYDDLDALAKTYKQDRQRYIDMRKALATIYSPKVVELFGVIAHLKEETAIDVCGKISTPINDIVVKLRKEKLLSLETSTVKVESTINGLMQYTTFTRDAVRSVAGLATVQN